MIEKIDMDKLQKLVYYINNVKMTGTQSEQLNRAIVGGILQGEIDTDNLFIGSVMLEISNIEQFLHSDSIIHGEWIQANDIYEEYTHWCGENNTKPESISMLGRVLKDLGVQFKKKADGNYYLIECNWEGENT